MGVTAEKVARNALGVENERNGKIDTKAGRTWGTEELKVIKNKE